MIDCKVGPQDQVEDLEAMARTLEASGTYRVLRRLALHITVDPPPGQVTRQGLVVDVETAGLDAACHEIIELAMMPFTYGLDGQIYAVGEPFHGLRQPAEPIPAEITSIVKQGLAPPLRRQALDRHEHQHDQQRHPEVEQPPKFGQKRHGQGAPRRPA